MIRSFIEFNQGFEQIPAIDPSFVDQPINGTVKILVIGTRQAVNQTIHRLHQLGFAEFSEWSRLLPAPTAGEVMRILVK